MIAKELRVDSEGKLWWRKSRRGRSCFKPVGTVSLGYLVFKLDGEVYRNSHIVWCLTYGQWPCVDIVIDHRDGDKQNDRPNNLRSVSQQANIINSKKQCNNTSGVTGVSPQKGKWIANIKVNRKQIRLGLFEKFEDAVAARKAAEKEYNFINYQNN